MTCKKCEIPMAKFGFAMGAGERIQRFRCRHCRATQCEESQRAGLRLPKEKIVQVVHMLVEGVGIRAIERLTNVHRDTILNVLEFAGKRSEQFFNNTILNVKVNAVQIDELYAFVNKKQRNCFPYEVDFGDQYTYLAIEPFTKLVLSYHTGKRDEFNTEIFINDLSLRVSREQSFDITSDGFPAYTSAVSTEFEGEAGYAQLVKNFHLLKMAKESGEHIPCMEKNIIFGERKNQSISTSYIERLNLSVRTFTKRFTRRTICYSKKLDNLRHSVALFVAHYNFCRIHSTIRTTPAVASGLVANPLTITDLLMP